MSDDMNPMDELHLRRLAATPEEDTKVQEWQHHMRMTRSAVIDLCAEIVDVREDIRGLHYDRNTTVQALLAMQTVVMIVTIILWVVK